MRYIRGMRRGACLSACLMFLLVIGFFGALVDMVLLWNIGRAVDGDGSALLPVLFPFLTNLLILFGVIGLWGWHRWGILSLTAGSLLSVVLASVGGLTFDGLLMAGLFLVLLYAMRQKWGLLH